MARIPVITAQAIPAKSGVALIARVVNYAGIPVTQATLASIAYTLTDLTAGTVVTTSQALVIADVIYDALQQDDISWTKDSAAAPGSDLLYGYNFKTVLPAAQILNGGDRYQCDVVFAPVSGEAFAIVFQFATLPVYF